MLLAEEPTSWGLAITIVVLMAAVMVAGGLVVVGVTKRTTDGRTGRNPIAGIRTAATLSSDEAWDAGQAAGRRMTLIGGWVGVIAGAASLPIAAMSGLAGLSPDLVVAVALIVSTGIGTAGMLGFAVAGLVRGNRAAIEVRDRTGDH